MKLFHWYVFIQDAVDGERLMLTEPFDSPHLVIYVHANTIQLNAMCGNSTKVVYDPIDAVDAVLLLIAVYYAFDLEYRKIFPKYWDFSSNMLLGKTITGITTSRFYLITTKCLDLN